MRSLLWGDDLAPGNTPQPATTQAKPLDMLQRMQAMNLKSSMSGTSQSPMSAAQIDTLRTTARKKAGITMRSAK